MAQDLFASRAERRTALEMGFTGADIEKMYVKHNGFKVIRCADDNAIAWAKTAQQIEGEV